jgi:hypothetical protein
MQTNEKIRALMLIRASIMDDGETIHVMLSEREPTPQLAVDLAALAAAIVVQAAGEDEGEALAFVDRYLAGLLDRERQ